MRKSKISKIFCLFREFSSEKKIFLKFFTLCVFQISIFKIKNHDKYDLSRIFNALIINYLVLCFCKNVRGKKITENFPSYRKSLQKVRKFMIIQIFTVAVT